MLSRVAERVYWLGRHLERVENTARLILVRHNAVLDLPREVQPGWDLLLQVLGAEQGFAALHGAPSEKNIIGFVFGERENPSSIISSLSGARENVRTTREILPSETWERVNSLYLYVRANAAEAARSRSQRYAVLDGVIERRQSIVGLLTGAMSHDVAYQFTKLGTNVERADMTTRIVDVNSAVLLPSDGAVSRAVLERLWMGTLKALSAYQMYRRHVGVHIEGAGVVHFLLTDMHFPRSVVHCLSELEGCLAALPHSAAAMKAVRVAWRRVEQMRFEDLAPVVLHDYLDQVQADLGAIHGTLAQQYFYLHQGGVAGA